MPRADHASDGIGCSHLEVYTVRVVANERQQLNAQDCDLFIDAFNLAGFV
jgi:hypothetical protein